MLEVVVSQQLESHELETITVYYKEGHLYLVYIKASRMIYSGQDAANCLDLSINC